MRTELVRFHARVADCDASAAVLPVMEEDLVRWLTLRRFQPLPRWPRRWPILRMFTSRECNKHRVLRDGAGHIFAFVPSSNGCKRLVAVAPQIGRRNSKRESSLWSGN